ncbi:MAG: NAD(P)/FAD-dependent oxidoreductase [Paracoccaceae bacterium]
MSGPLDDALYDVARPVGSYWAAALPPSAPRASLAGDVRAEVAVVGAGYTGLSAALALAEAGVDVAVVDAGAVGWGASGRSGGICGPGGAKLPGRAMARRHGAAGVAAWPRAQGEAIAWVRAFHEREGLATQGDGEMVLAHSPRAARGLARLAEADPDHCTPVAPSGRDDAARFGGVIERPAFGIQPLAYVRALAAAAERAGARVFERSRVVEWTTGNGGHRLATATGALDARRVLVATNGFTPVGLAAPLDGLAVPVISNIAVTRPLTAGERARHPWFGETPTVDTRHMLSYYRLLPGGRLLYGARGDLTGSEAGGRRMLEHLKARIRADLPGFAEAAVDYFWRGPIAATTRLTPTVAWLDEDARVAVALGWHGSGIAMGSLGGRLAAALLAGETAAIPEPMRGLPRRFRPAGLAPAAVGLAIALMRVADRMPLPSRKG